MTTVQTETPGLDPTFAEPTPNVELLRATLRHIIRHPEEWAQEDWRSCQTAGCFAFHAAVLSGEPFEWLSKMSRIDPWLVRNSADTKGRDWGGLHEGVHVMDRAQRVLGLTDGQAETLFCANNSLDYLRYLVGELTGGAR